MKYRINPRTYKLNRRTLLRSSTLGVSTIAALPLMEAMFSSDEAFAQTAAKMPKFYGFYCPNGHNEALWYPKGDTITKQSLQGTALEHFGELGLENDISCYRKMQNEAEANPQKRATGNGHLYGIASWLTGVSILPHDSHKDSDQGKYHKPSFEQEFSRHCDTLLNPGVAEEDRMNPDAMALRMAGNAELDTGRMDYNNNMKNGLNWDWNNEILPLDAEIDKQFDRLYSDKGVMRPGNGGNQVSALSRRQQLKITILDDLARDREALIKRLGQEDLFIAERYFDALREIERRIEQMQESNQMMANNPIDCDAPMSKADAAKGRMVAKNGDRAGQIGPHMKVAAVLIPHAMSCGLIHSASYCAGGEAAGCLYRDVLAKPRHFHNNVSHSAPGKDFHLIDKWHARHFAMTMQEMKNISYGGGTLLDASSCMFGTGLGNGSKHSRKDIGMLVGGGLGGRWKHGKVRTLPGKGHGSILQTIRKEHNMSTKMFMKENYNSKQDKEMKYDLVDIT